MGSKGLLNYRILFSSHQGIHRFYADYLKYCQISKIDTHIRPDILTNIQPHNDNEMEGQIKQSMTGTLTQTIMNFIKLKISKKDAMRISTAVGVPTTSILKPSRILGVPTPSPPKNQKKGRQTALNLR
jgi:hypothetical protein